MALVAVAVTLGTPNSVGQVPVTVTNLAASIAQAVTDTTTLATAITTADNDAATSGTDFDFVYTTAVNGLLALFPGVTYNSTTKQFGGAPSASQTLTTTQQTNLLNLMNTLGTALVTLKTDTATAKTAATTVQTDHTASQAIITSANVYIQSDSTVATNVALINGALVAALTFLRDSAILPT